MRSASGKIWIQYITGICLVLAVAFACYSFRGVLEYKLAALLLLVTVSVLASIFRILPVLVASVLSALILNFFFIPPFSTFHISTAEDLLLFAMYFVIAPVNAVFTYKIRKTEKKAREKEEKEKTIRLYNTLLNSLSHELKTPISTIIGAVDTLRENRAALTPGQTDELFGEIQQAGFRLSKQVANLLNMSRLESGFLELKKDWCEISELVHTVINRLSEEASAHTIHYQEQQDLPLFKIDMVLVEQAVSNIIANALQYTPAGSVITVFATHQENSCVITISDNGPGFPEDKLELVFEKFYRLPDSGTGGTGLGLSIAKGFIESHNGRIVLKNKSGGGAEFTLEIPAETSYINNLKHE